MNLYFLVEGKRTEMAVYPFFLSQLLPALTRVRYPSQAVHNNYYMVSGFGYPNLLSYIENSVKDLNRYPAYDYLVICLDSDSSAVYDRVRTIRQLMRRRGLNPKYGRVQVIVQKKCIETWFLGCEITRPTEGDGRLRPFLEHYDVFEKDPERMDSPGDFHGSVGDYHVAYLYRLCEGMGKHYTKRDPGAVCTPAYFESMVAGLERRERLKTFQFFLRFCRGLRRRMERELQWMGEAGEAPAGFE